MYIRIYIYTYIYIYTILRYTCMVKPCSVACTTKPKKRTWICRKKHRHTRTRKRGAFTPSCRSLRKYQNDCPKGTRPPRFTTPGKHSEPVLTGRAGAEAATMTQKQESQRSSSPDHIQQNLYLSEFLPQTKQQNANVHHHIINDWIVLVHGACPAGIVTWDITVASSPRRRG